MVGGSGVVDTADIAQISRPQSTADYFAALDVELHSEGGDTHTSAAVRDMSECKLVLSKGLQVLPSFHMLALNDLTLNFTTEGKRGMAGAGNLIIKCSVESDMELLAVFIHEMGHIVDGNALTGSGEMPTAFVDLGKTVSADDPSYSYYKYSWVDDDVLRPGASANDFCSTYGMTDPYEDFAECYSYYILHGNEFRLAMGRSPVLAQKYAFLKDYVFFGREYVFDAGFENPSRSPIVYDTTKLSYNYGQL